MQVIVNISEDAHHPFDITKVILSGVRKYKSENRLPANAPIGDVVARFEYVNCYDLKVGSSVYDILGATNAQRLIIEMPSCGKHEAVRVTSWDEDSKCADLWQLEQAALSAVKETK